MLKYLPTADSTGIILFKKPTAQDYGEYTGRVDWTIGPKDRATIRYFLDRFHNVRSSISSNLLTYADGSDIQYHNALISETHTFNDRWLNNFIISYQLDDSNARSLGQQYAQRRTTSASTSGSPATRPSSLSIGDGPNVSIGDNPPGTFNRANYTLSDDVHWTKGAHTISFGFHGEISKVDVHNTSKQPGSFGFSTATTGDVAASFLLGYLSSFNQGSGQFINNRGKFYGFYAQDSWKATRRLTLNYGLRYEPAFPWHEKFHRIGTFNPIALAAGRVSTVYPNAPAGLLFPGDAGVPEDGYNGSYKDFMPRLGFAWDVFGDGRPPSALAAACSLIPVRTASSTTPSPTFSPSSPRSTVTFQPGNYKGVSTSNFHESRTPVPLRPLPIPSLPSSLRLLRCLRHQLLDQFMPDGNFPVPTTYVWNLALEQQLSQGLASRIAYVGTHGSHNFHPSTSTPPSTAVTNSGQVTCLSVSALR